MQPLDRSFVPDLPQRQFLRRVLEDLWQAPAIVCIWLTGSLVRGARDSYSDGDLGIAMQPAAFTADQLPAAARLLTDNAVVHTAVKVGEQATLYQLLLAQGELYDLMVQTTEHPMREQVRFVLACRHEAFAAQLSRGTDLPVQVQPADGEVIRAAIVTFWLTQVHQQQALYRDLGLVAWAGEQIMRQDLIRLWDVRATGGDGGPLRRVTMHKAELCRPDTSTSSRSRPLRYTAF